ncbi:Aryl-phospho-beta-D-glucosidase BglC, GH1 family [Mucilaginibacter sp. OK268]|uniref:cellulase family glycosylhydrolase n=1 Tax=Mucilaginibacter sp. OK268 TaxID=1881048 RepID=UPI0008817705|nr:cellulase family glycosylhydrolase [Mucilaginibacter sp. OK268]SDP28980.1 Aryl-phospho-beta-D-glucosidase BglC, GH1 family [Mucilaginibacter sp. OK268]
MKKIKIKAAYRILGIAIVIIAAVSCKKTGTASPELTLSNITQAIPEDGGTAALAFTTNAAWSVDTTGIGWLHLDKISGNSGDAAIKVTAAANSSGSTRSVLLNVSSSNGQSRRITVMQNARIFPSYNISPKAPDVTGMGSTASQIAANITYGWNFYNTMEAPGSETGWGNPPITQQMFDLIKSTGVNAVRIPIRYDGHFIDTKTMQIDPTWLARIKQVIQYGINDNMYVTINIHYDPGSETGAQQDTANAKHKAIWEQVATYMRDFDEHLMFASANEPNASDVPTTVTLMRYHQSFINAVRGTGGKNTYRTIVIQSPSTSIDLLNAYLDPTNVYKIPTLPTDPTPHKMMLEFHYYSPSQFCILGGPGTIPGDASWGKELYFWGKDFHTTNPNFLDRNCTSANEEAYVDSIMHTMKARFADKGIPLFMGEYASNYHAGKLTGYPADSLLALKSATHFTAYIAQQAKANGVIPFLWAGIFDRRGKDGVPQGPTIVGDTATLNAVKLGVNAGVDKFGSGAKFH